ncbi:MAG: ribosomal protein S18-alanine N-acetyltransferase, partial [Streptococcus sp.]|nr:ribosomal protein S18-alanine N-acetyltransferase [Streptococcus sp.]
MWNEFKERFVQWFEKIKALFLEEAQQMDPIRDQFENFEKRVILGNGAQAKIRIGLPEDATRIFEVEKAAYDGESPWAKDVLEKDVAHNPAAIYIVLEAEDEIVGFIGARTTESADLHITNVAVLHDYRFLNVATLLLKALEKIARALDKKEITLEARVSNTKAIKLYRKNGYEVVGTKENYYTPENEDAVEMLYALPPKTPSSFHSSEYSFTRLHPADLAMAEALVALVQENYEHPNNWSAESFLADLENPT